MYTARSSIEEHAICVGSVDVSERTCLLGNSSKVTYAPPGYVLYVRDGTLLAHPFNVTRMQLTGEPIVVAADVWFNAGTGGASFSVSPTGMLIYATGQRRELQWVDRKGQSLQSIPEGDLTAFSLSPDERRVVGQRVHPQLGSSDIWVLDLLRGLSTRLTFDPEWDENPIWSPDGTAIIFRSGRRGGQQWYRIPATGAREEELLFEAEVESDPQDWSPDGELVLYERFTTAANADLWVLRLSEPGQPRPFAQRPFNEVDGQFSPNGKWVAYASDESARYEVYVQSFPEGGMRQQVSLTGGRWPRWRRDGEELFYVAADGRLTAVDIRLERNLEVGIPEPLFQVDVEDARVTFPYAVAADGQRFLVRSTVDEDVTASINVVVNWTAQLKQ